MTLLPPHLWLLLAAAPSPTTGPPTELQLILDGIVSHAEFEPGRWVREDGRLVGRGNGQVLFSKHRLGEGPFRVDARLSLDELGGTAAAVMLGEDSFFGLDGVGGRLFVGGALFDDELRFVGDEPAPLTPGELFDFSVQREERGPVRIRIDGETTYEFEHEGRIGPFGFSPWHGTLRVESFRIEGALEPLPPVPRALELFRPELEGYAVFRVPVLAGLPEGLVLAFAEARDGLAELAGNDIVLRRSRDGGRHFGPLEVVAEDGENALVNPCLTVLPRTNSLLLMFQRYAAGVLPAQVRAGGDSDDCTTFLTRSEDGGESWSRPRNLTSSLRWRDEVTTMATGPGHGLVLRSGDYAGRILVPMNQGPIGAWHLFAAFSEDGGDTWDVGAPAPVGPGTRATEVQMIELADGRVLLNARSLGRTQRRISATSSDGGLSWSRLRTVDELADPPCSASLLRWSDPTEAERGLLLFANPATRFGRRLGTLFTSRDEGESWERGLRLHRGWFGYCSLGRLEADTLGCLYEADGGRVIRLARVPAERFVTR